MRDRIRDRSWGVLFVSIFLAAWAGQLVFEWLDFVNEQVDYGKSASFWSEPFWAAFSQSTLENWQSEFLQLSAFTIACAYFVHKGLSESSDSSERLEAKLDALLESGGLDPQEVEQVLPLEYRWKR